MQNISHLPINITDISISYVQKQCINNFDCAIYSGSKIGIIGSNGSGKSSLIKILAGLISPTAGKINLSNTICAYIPQLINNDNRLSGGQRFNKALSEALSLQPNLLLLDEPTNHLDTHNRKALIGMLKRYNGTLIIATHDIELLNNCVNSIWHVAHGQVTTFNGSYNDYLCQERQKWQKLTNQVARLNKEQKNVHENLMHEQSRAKNSRRMGEKNIKQRKWPTITSTTKARRAETTTGKNQKQLANAKQNISAMLAEIYIPEAIVPKFNLSSKISGIDKTLITIYNGSCGYTDKPVLHNINLTLNAKNKIVIHGANGSGKSTLIKALLNDNFIHKSGDWQYPGTHEIGYLDQHYSHFNQDNTAVELVQNIVPAWSHANIRDHLNSFLLRKNEEVNIPAKDLSGGEKVRLSLALIAAQVPKLLLLDEITNNIDLETKEHVINVLNEYPGAYILICHDADFIEQLSIDIHYEIKNGVFNLQLL